MKLQIAVHVTAFLTFFQEADRHLLPKKWRVLHAHVLISENKLWSFTEACFWNFVCGGLVEMISKAWCCFYIVKTCNI